MAQSTSASTPPPIAREFRAAWVASVANIDWPSRPGLTASEQRTELLAILDRAVALKLNAIVLQVRTAADALYDSPYEPWSEYLSGQQGLAPEPAYDPLRFAVKEAHERGIELHAWFNPFRASHPSSKTPDTALTHVTRTGIVSAPRYGRHRWMDPGDPRVRTHSLKVITDVARRYDVDGVHIDDYFYPYREQDKGVEIPFPDSISYAAYVRSGGKLERDDWRRNNVDVFVRDMYRDVRGLHKSSVKVGVSPFGMWRPQNPPPICCFDPYVQLYADSKKWLQNGWVDYFTPQLYWQTDSATRSYATLLKWWTEQNTVHRHMWPGLFTSKAGGPWLKKGEAWGAGEITRQIAITRAQPGATGHVHFSMKSLMDERADSLSHKLMTERYQEPALVPASRWLDSIPPRAPSARLVADTATGGRRLTLTPATGEPVWLWTVQELRDGQWTTRILPGMQRSTAVSRNGRERAPESVWVTAVDRSGNQSTGTRAR
ncbi:MAG: family 10 glycosylhydrolase [Gemmatimonadaceae bacterium]|nr:family 10 glycosylhydrolase [Gemmatimonadaceae bacterium]